MVDSYDDLFRPESLHQAKEILTRIKDEELSKWEDTPEETRDELKGLRDVTSGTLDDPTHILPELMQNADDIGGKCTEVSIELTEDRLVFQNIEEPMTVENVEALGAYTKSTKRGDLSSIGHFGIGFKTVFGLTDTVKIHSGYFSFQYTDDERTIPEPINYSEQPATNTEYYNGTTVVLPLSDDAKRNRIDIVEEQLRSISSLLPFLNHITTVKVSIFGEKKTFTGEPSGNNGFEVTCKYEGERTKNERVRLFSDSFEPEQKTLKKLAEKRDLDTEALLEQDPSLNIKIAISVDDNGAPQPRDKSHLFCYFPTDPNTRLPFHIQADFSLKPNRKHIKWPDDFNEKLLECVSDVFEKAFVQLHREQVDPSKILELVPDPSLDRDSTPYIESVVEEIISFVRSESCVPDNEKNLFRPSEVVFLQQPFRRLLTENELRESLNRPVKYPSEQISDDARQRLQAIVPGSQLELERLLENCTEASMFESRENEWLLQFMAGIMRYWNSKYDTSNRLSYEDRKAKESFRDCVKSVPFLPLEEGSNSSYSALDEEIYRLSSSGSKDYEILTDSDEITLLDKDIVSSIDNPDEEFTREASLAGDLLFDQILSIGELEPKDIVRNVINPAFESDTIEPSRVDQFVLYIANRSKTLAEDVELKLQANSKEGSDPVFYPPEKLYFGQDYIDSYDTETIFAVFDDLHPVANHYIELGDLTEDEWTEALADLGVKQRIEVVDQDPWKSARFESESEIREFLDQHGDNDETNIHDEEFLSGYNGRGNYRWMKREVRHGNIKKFKYALIDRYLPDETERVLSKLTGGDDIEESYDYWVEFLKMLDEWWKEYYSTKVFYDYRYSEFSNKYKVRKGECNCPSSFGKFLIESVWAPGHDGEIYQPQNLFIRNELTEGKPVPYIEPKPSSSGLRDFLDLQRSPGVHVTISTLSALIQNQQKNLPEVDSTQLESTIRQQLHLIDSGLEEDSTEDEDQEAIKRLKEIPFIYVRNAETKFRKPSEVTLEGTRLGNFLHPISDTYPDFSSLFERLGVRREPELEDYISFLGTVDCDQSADESLGNDIEEAWWQILQTVVYIPRDKLGASSDMLENTIEMLDTNGKILTAANTLTDRDEVKYHSTNETLLFDLPSSIQTKVLHPRRNLAYSNPTYQDRLESLTGTKPLEEALDRNLTNEIAGDKSEETLSERNPILLDVAYSFVQSTDNSSSDQLKEFAKFAVYTTEEICCRYSLKGEYVVTTYDSRCFVDTDSSLIVLKDENRAEFALIEALVTELDLPLSDKAQLRSLLKGALGKSEQMVSAFLDDSEYEYHRLSTTEIAPLDRNSESGTQTQVSQEKSVSISETEVELKTSEDTDGTADSTPSDISSVVENEDSKKEKSSGSISGSNKLHSGEQIRENFDNIDIISRNENNRQTKSSKTKTNGEKTTNSENSSSSYGMSGTSGSGGSGSSSSGGSGGGGGWGVSDDDKTEIGDEGEAFMIDELRKAVEEYFKTNGQLMESTEDEKQGQAVIHGVCNDEQLTVKIVDESTKNIGYDLLLAGASIELSNGGITISELDSGTETLVEVKSTKTDYISQFTLTKNEYETALKNPEEYVIVRVYKALSQKPYVHRLFDRVPKLTEHIDGTEFRPDDVVVEYNSCS